MVFEEYTDYIVRSKRPAVLPLYYRRGIESEQVYLDDFGTDLTIQKTYLPRIWRERFITEKLLHKYNDWRVVLRVPDGYEVPIARFVGYDYADITVLYLNWDPNKQYYVNLASYSSIRGMWELEKLVIEEVLPFYSPVQTEFPSEDYWDLYQSHQNYIQLLRKSETRHFRELKDLSFTQLFPSKEKVKEDLIFLIDRADLAWRKLFLSLPLIIRNPGLDLVEIEDILTFLLHRLSRTSSLYQLLKVIVYSELESKGEKEILDYRKRFIRY